jgi:hypothetical protein
MRSVREIQHGLSEMPRPVREAFVEGWDAAIAAIAELMTDQGLDAPDALVQCAHHQRRRLMPWTEYGRPHASHPPVMLALRAPVSPSMTFTTWLMTYYLDKDNEVGDLARAAKADAEWPADGTRYHEFVRHLLRSDAPDALHRSLDAAWGMWMTYDAHVRLVRGRERVEVISGR